MIEGGAQANPLSASGDSNQRVGGPQFLTGSGPGKVLPAGNPSPPIEIDNGDGFPGGSGRGSLGDQYKEEEKLEKDAQQAGEKAGA